MSRSWRIVFFAAVAAILVPAFAALGLVLIGKGAGCAPDAMACDGLGGALSFTLMWAWHRVLDPMTLGLLTGAAAIGAGLGFETRRTAMLWGAMGACWGPIAALLLPYVAVYAALPRSCAIAGGASSACMVWGQDMGEVFGAAGQAFWLSVFIIPIALGGVVLTAAVAAAAEAGRHPR